MDSQPRQAPALPTEQPAPSPRREWTAPTVQDLPPLSQLTLQTEFVPGGEGVF